MRSRLGAGQDASEVEQRTEVHYHAIDLRGLTGHGGKIHGVGTCDDDRFLVERIADVVRDVVNGFSGNTEQGDQQAVLIHPRTIGVVKAALHYLDREG